MSSDESNVSDKIDILSTEDEKLKTIGAILSSDSSRQILKMLFNNSLSANQISQKTEMSLPLVIHHLKKMQGAGVVKIANVGKNTKSHDVKYYTVDKVAIVILPSEMQQPAKKSKSLLNSFNRIHRLATLGGASIAAWFSSQMLQSGPMPNTEYAQSIPADLPSVPEESAMRSAMSKAAEIDETASPYAQTGEPSFDFLWSTVVVLSVIVAGLVVEVIISSKKKKQLTDNR